MTQVPNYQHTLNRLHMAGKSDSPLGRLSKDAADIMRGQHILLKSHGNALRKLVEAMGREVSRHTCRDACCVICFAKDQIKTSEMYEEICAEEINETA